MSENPRLHLQTDLSEQQNAGFTPCEQTAAADSHSSDDGTRACGVSSWQISNILLLWRLSLSVSTNIPALNRSRIIWEHQTPHRPLCFFVRGLVCSWASRSEPPGGDYHSLLSGAPSPSSGGIPGTMFSAHRRTEIQPKSPTPLDLSLTQFGGGILWVWISWKHQLHKENLQQQNTERRAAHTDRQAGRCPGRKSLSASLGKILVLNKNVRTNAALSLLQVVHCWTNHLKSKDAVRWH